MADARSKLATKADFRWGFAILAIAAFVGLIQANFATDSQDEHPTHTPEGVHLQALSPDDIEFLYSQMLNSGTMEEFFKHNMAEYNMAEHFERYLADITPPMAYVPPMAYAEAPSLRMYGPRFGNPSRAR